MKIGKLSYNGKTAESLGVFVSGAGTYNAAEEDVTAYEVPGRNGDILISNNRYRNIDVNYPAFIPSDFEERVQAIRNWMRSARSYARIEDNYDLLHFRMGVGKDILSFSPAQQNRAANCQLVFNCKPQRFLYSGEEDFTPGEWGPTETLSGDIVSFENEGNKAFKSLTLPISPVQSLNGYDGPWPGGAGKNKLPNTEKRTSTGSGVTWVPNDIGEVACTGTPTANTYKNYGHVVLPAGTYTVTGIPETAPITGSRNAGLRVTKGAYTYGSDADLLALISFPTATSGTFTIEEEADVYLRLYVYTTSGTITDFVFKPMIRLSSEADDTWEPYENICPISGWDGANVTVSPTTTGGTVYPVTWSEAGTVYSGEVDIVSGELTVDTMMVTLTGEESAARYVWDAYSLTVPGLVDVNNEVNVIACSHTDTFITGLRMSVTSATDEYPVAVCTSAGPRVRFRNREAGSTLEEYRAYLQAQNSAGTPVQVVARLATPQTYQLTPTQVLTLLGANNVWSDTGTVEAEIGENPNVLENPTLFDARPLITLTNPETGATVTIGEYTLTCLEAYSGTVTIDCENEDIYSGPQNLNNKWSGSFPVLKPGNNPVSISGATGTIKPRWWEL